MYYEQQNIFLSGLLKRVETKKTSGHSRKEHPAVSPHGKRIGRPPAEISTDLHLSTVLETKEE